MYGESKEIILQLGLKDVYLGFYKDRNIKNKILNLRSGQKLILRDRCAYVDYVSDRTKVAVLSRSAYNNLISKLSKGYKVYDVKVAFIVAWTDRKAADENDMEWAVLLPALYLKR